MKFALLTGLLLAVFGIGFFTGRGIGKAEHSEAVAEWAGGLLPGQSGIPGRDAASTERGISEAERRVRSGARPFARGNAGLWVEGVFNGVLEDFDGRGDYIDFLWKLTFLDEEMLREATVAWAEKRLEIPDTKETFRGRQWVALLESDLYRQWMKSDLQGALDQFFSTPAEKRSGVLAEAVFADWFKRDPAAARAGLDRLNREEKGMAVSGILGVVMENDPAQALREMASFNTDNGAEAAAEKLSKSDPQLAMELSAGLAQTAGGKRALLKAAELWAETDASAAETWLRNHKGAGRNEALTYLLEKRLDTDFDRIAENFPALIAGSPIEDQTVGFAAKILEKKAKMDSLPEAAEWTKRLPEGQIRNSMQWMVAVRWIETNTLQASEWIRQMPPSLQRDGSAERLIEAIQLSDPASALEWAKTISKPEMKEKALDGIFKTWRETNPEAAMAAQAALGK